jgi:hypothetical protein
MALHVVAQFVTVATVACRSSWSWRSHLLPHREWPKAWFVPPLTDIVRGSEGTVPIRPARGGMPTPVPRHDLWYEPPRPEWLGDSTGPTRGYMPFRPMLGPSVDVGRDKIFLPRGLGGAEPSPRHRVRQNSCSAVRAGPTLSHRAWRYPRLAIG